MGSTGSPHLERDDDEPADGSVFDDGDNIFEEDVDDEDQEGIFRDERSTFSSAHSTPEDHHNPLTTRLQEEERWETAKGGPLATRPAAPVISKQLVVKFDGRSQPFVARHENGKAVERYRRPTQEEFHKIQTKARLVKGGVGEVTPAAAVASPGLPWKKIAMYGGGAAVVGLGSWFLWKKFKRDNDGDAEVDVVDD